MIATAPWAAALLLAPALLSTPAHAQDAHTLFEVRGDVLAAAAAGDVDADGTPDFLVGRASGRTEVRSGRTGQVLHESLFSQPSSGQPFFGAAGDLDRDGHADWFVRSFVYSGRTGELLFRAPGELLVRIGDVDGNGVRELLASQPDASIVRCGGDQLTIGVGASTGKAWVLTGPRGEVLYELEDRAGSKSFGGALAALGDLDHDGVDDFAVLDQTLGFGNVRPCGLARTTVHAFSSRTGEHLWQVTTNALDVAALDDLNGDGAAEIAVGNYGVDILSGADGTLLTTFAAGGTNALDFVGVELDRAPDLDGDGVRELLVAGNQRATSGLFGSSFSTGPGFVAVLSPMTGAILSRVEGDDLYDAFGTWIASLGDVNGDDAFDYVAFATSGTGDDYVRVVSTAALTLASDVHDVSIASGGVQRLTIDVGDSAGSSVGLLLGSLTGTGPGVSFGGARLPLVPDAYFRSLLVGEATLLNASPHIQLDANGRAVRDVVVPAGLPLTLAGRTVFHAFVLFDPSAPFDPTVDRTPRALVVSPFVPLSLVP